MEFPRPKLNFLRPFRKGYLQYLRERKDDIRRRRFFSCSEEENARLAVCEPKDSMEFHYILWDTSRHHE